MTSHPLDPLTGQEIGRAAEIARTEPDASARWRIVFVLPSEPEKTELRSWEAGGTRPPRRALVVVRDKGEKRTIELVVDLDAATVESRSEPQGIQPAVMREESVEAERLAREHPEWQAAMRRRGVTDLDLAMLDHMPLGYQDADDGPQQRRGIALTWMRAPQAGADGAWQGDNGYARPVEGLIVHFDLDTMEVLRVEDHGGAPIPTAAGNFTEAALHDPANVPSYPDGPRQSTRPVEINQPQGASFSVDGWSIEWEKWRLRVGFNVREGLVLHDVGYVDRGRPRRVLHRASLSEMFVPYADPAVTHFRKQLFDQGEAGIGRCVNSLRLGCDCLGEIYYFDAVMHDNDGNPIELPNAICMHEEDYGLLWKHTTLRTGVPESRRSRRLVISSFTTVGNYDYGFFWYLYQDGRIEFEAKLTGILSTGAFAPDAQPEYGTVLAEGLYGPNHQHWFNMRLDMAVDGDANTLLEVNSHAVEDPEVNYFGGAWKSEATVLATELEAQREIEPRSARYWRVANTDSLNSLGQPASYSLIPGHNTFHLYRPGAPALGRAAFIDRHLWATAYRPRELYAAGDYPNQHPGGAGLPDWTRRDAPLDQRDLVLWYTFGAHHVTRPEDWPVMPMAYAGFELKPHCFFDGNPALDVAEEAPHCHAG
jgi:primary-amine oxidase